MAVAEELFSEQNSGVGSDTAEVEAAKEAERRATARG